MYPFFTLLRHAVKAKFNYDRICRLHMSGILIDQGSEHDKASIALATKQGRRINNLRRQERHPQSMQDAEQYMQKNCPGIETRSLSSSYNCVGMVFAARRVVIEPDLIPMIFLDDEYHRVFERSRLQIGDLIIYKKSQVAGEIDHIGVIVNVELLLKSAEIKIQVLSQWGFEGEYLHDEENVPPHYGRYREYYSERRYL